MVINSKMFSQEEPTQMSNLWQSTQEAVSENLDPVFQTQVQLLAHVVEDSRQYQRKRMESPPTLRNKTMD